MNIKNRFAGRMIAALDRLDKIKAPIVEVCTPVYEEGIREYDMAEIRLKGDDFKATLPEYIKRLL